MTGVTLIVNRNWRHNSSIACVNPLQAGHSRMGRVQGDKKPDTKTAAREEKYRLIPEGDSISRLARVIE
jgi:hypothetical protein